MHTLRLIFGRWRIVHIVWRNCKKDKRGFFQTMYDMINYAEIDS
jgi:hypothetical protein